MIQKYTPAILANFNGIHWEEIPHLPHDLFQALTGYIDEISGGEE